MLEEVVWSLLEWNSAERVEVGSITLLELFGEGFISIEGSAGELERYSERGREKTDEERAGNLPDEVEFESTERTLPAAVDSSEEGDSGSQVKGSDGERVLRAVARAQLVGLKASYLIEEIAEFTEVCGSLVLGGEESPIGD